MPHRLHYTSLLWIRTASKSALIADALRTVPATRLHVEGEFVHILYDETQWTDVSEDVARHRVMDAMALAGIEFEQAIGPSLGRYLDAD